MKKMGAILLVGGIVACGGADPTSPGGAHAASMQVVAGDNQEGFAGSPLPRSIEVYFADANGHAVGGVTASGVIVSGGGSLDPASVVSGSNGHAKFDWSMGTDLDAPNILEIRASSLPSVTASAVSNVPGTCALYR